MRLLHLIIAFLVLTSLSSITLAQIPSHPLSQLYPMDVNLLLLFVPLAVFFGDKIKKVLIDLDVLTIAESERRDDRKEKAIGFLNTLEKQKVEVFTPTFILKQLKLWKNTDLVTKIVTRIFKLSGELLDPDDVDEVLIKKTGKRLKEFAEFGAKEIGTKPSDFILVLYASIKEVDHIVTFNKKHLKNKENQIADFLRKYNL